MKKLLFLLPCLLALTACPKDDSPNQTKLHELENKIIQLESRLTTQESVIQSLQKDGASNWWDTFLLKQKFQSSAYFTPASKGYAPVWTSAGNLLVSLDNIEKYADGYKLFFRIGNPTLATFSNVTFKTEWNKAYTADQNYAEWEKKSKSNSIQLTSNLLPAKWNNVVVVISPAKEEETGSIQVTIDTSSVYLY